MILLLAIFFILLFILILFVKIHKQCKQFGKENVFRISYTGKKIDMEDYVCMMLKQIPCDHWIEKKGHWILYLCESGIYLFYCFKEKGIITGNVQDEILTCSIGKRKTFTPNPLPSFINQIQRLEEYPIVPYLIVENHCQFLVKENPISTIFLKNVYYDLYQRRAKVYEKEQLEAFHQKLLQFLEKNA